MKAAKNAPHNEAHCRAMCEIVLQRGSIGIAGVVFNRPCDPLITICADCVSSKSAAGCIARSDMSQKNVVH
jgi:hypothetical protein